MSERVRKFRVFNKVLNRYLTSVEIDEKCYFNYTSEDNNITAFVDCGGEDWTFVFEDYAGLKDCEGKEIYEGDIVKGFGCIFVVRFGIACIKKLAPDSSINEVDVPSFYFETAEGVPVYPIVKNYKGEHDLKTLKIIGNINQNPELLEDKT